MALLAPQAIPVTGLAPTFGAASGGGDTCNPDDLVLLLVNNASGGSINVTIVTPQTLYGQAVPDVVVAVAAATLKFIDLPSSLADPTTGLVSWSYSATASVTAALIR